MRQLIRFIIFLFCLFLAIGYASAQSTDKLMRKARKARIDSDYEKAHYYLTRVIEIDPNNGQAFLQRSEINQLRRLPDSSLIDKYNYAKVTGGYKKIWHDLFFEFVEKDDIVRINECAVHFAQFDSSDYGDYLYGMALFHAEDYNQAKFYFEKAIAENDSNAVYYFQVAQSYFHLHSFRKAEENYSKAYTYDPHNGYIYVGLGSVEYLKGNYQKALKLLDTGLSYSETNKLYGYFYRGMCYIKLEQIEKGCNDIEEANKYGEIPKGIDYINICH